MPEIIPCPSCRRKLRLPAGLPTRLVQCPTCGTMFEAARPDTEAPVLEVLPLDDPEVVPDEPPGPAPDPLPRPTPARVHHTACEFCNQPIRPETVRCPFCGEFLGAGGHGDDLGGDRPWERDVVSRQDPDASRAALLLTLGIASIAIGLFGCAPVGLPVGVVGWVKGQAELRRIAGRNDEPDHHDYAYAGWLCSVVGTILNAACGIVWVLWGFVVFAAATLNGNRF